MRRQLVAVNEAVQYKEFDRFKVLRACVVEPYQDKLLEGGIYIFTETTWSDPNRYYQIALIPNGKERTGYKDIAPRTLQKNHAMISPFAFAQLLSKGIIVLVNSDADLSIGDIDIDDVKDVFINLGVPKAIKKSIDKIVYRTSATSSLPPTHYQIDLGEDIEISKQYYFNIIKGLQKRGIEVPQSFIDNPQNFHYLVVRIIQDPRLGD